MIRRLLQQEEIYIRIQDEGMDFVYTVKRGEKVLESAVISPESGSRRIGGGDNGYYGDSRVVD